MAFQLPQEFQKEVFELTLALYRVTDFFPKNDTLRRSLREKANEIFGLITEYNHSRGGENDALLIFARIESIKGYLDIARTMRLVKQVNLSVLYREYEFLGQFFKNESRLSDIKNTHFSGDTKVSYRKEEEESLRDKNRASHRKFSGSVKPSADHIVDPVRGRPANPVRNTISNGAGAAATTASGRSASNGVDPIVDGANVSNFSGSVLNRSDATKEGRESSQSIKSVTSSEVHETPVRSQKEKNSKGHIGHVAKPEGVSERQKAIIGHMKKADKKARLGDIHALFGDVSSKTIQRDLSDLVSKNILRKEGEKRWTTYFFVVG